MSCNLSFLMQKVYRENTDFHDHYVVYYLNKYKDPKFHFNFTVGNWTDMGIAQWAGGFVTQALVNVRTIKQIVRDGMWRIGTDSYYSTYFEYSSWCVLQGYPQAWLYSVDDARTLLYALAARNADGIALRKFITYQGTTFVGNGFNYSGGVGNVGEYTFTLEANLNRFACIGVNEAACRLMDVVYASSAAYCNAVEALYSSCQYQYQFANSRCK